MDDSPPTLRRLRQDAGYTREQVAEALATTAPSIYRWESGTAIPHLRYIRPLADLYGVGVDAVLASLGL
jgi:transcriptional regulator with XRE-family HTH domain